jgi:hypothetical protein
MVAAWSKALSADADILLYGCDVAATAQGRLLADTLARLTGADVSASDDATGHASLGGDWNLEYKTGAIDVAVAPSESAQEAWSHLLPSVVLTSYEPSPAATTDYQVTAGTSYVQSFTSAERQLHGQPDRRRVVQERLRHSGNISVELRALLREVRPASGTVSFNSLSLSENWITVSLDDTESLTMAPPITSASWRQRLGNVFVGIDDAGSYAGGNAIVDGTTSPRRTWPSESFHRWAGHRSQRNQQGQDESVTFTEQTLSGLRRGYAHGLEFDEPDGADGHTDSAPDGDTVESPRSPRQRPMRRAVLG